ncbi:MAG: GspE/PulE family protein [bacterium]
MDRRELHTLLVDATKRRTLSALDGPAGASAFAVAPLAEPVATEADLIRMLASRLGFEALDVANVHLVREAVQSLPRAIAERHNVLPIERLDDALVVAMSDPLDLVALDDIRAATRLAVRPVVARALDIERLRERAYKEAEGSRSIQKAVENAAIEVSRRSSKDDLIDPELAAREAENAPVIELVNQVIAQALFERATDIHIEPGETELVIRFRVDGLLADSLMPPKALAMGLLTRIKILADLDIAERRKPQDGRFTVRHKEREVDVRVSTLPTLHGEKAVLRLLDKTSFRLDLTSLGFEPELLAAFQRAIRQPYGMILLSGPTGAGKSTTLYAALGELNSQERNITTVEDPIEYQIPRINQVQVSPRKDLTFVTALRYIMRQDPDVIMVGEIRDRETAEMTVRAAMTGHMVLSTVHANDAPMTATRIVTMGVEPFQAASALALVVAQRLVRRVCPHCKIEVDAPVEKLMGLGTLAERSRPKRFFEGTGCSECRKRKYLGRIAIFEVLPIDNEIKELIAQRAPAQAIAEVAARRGMQTLRESGLRKVEQGLTTVDEVIRVCLQEG